MANKMPSFFKKLDSHMKEIVRGAATAFSLKIVAAGLAFVFNIVIARLLGAEGAGQYFLAFTLITIAATLGRVGLDNTLVRFIASAANKSDWGYVKGVYRQSLIMCLIASSGIALILFFASPFLARFVFGDPELTGVFKPLSIAIVPFAVFILHSHALKGIKKVRDSITTQSVLAPFFSIVFAFLLIPVAGAAGAAMGYLFAAVLTMLIGVWLWRLNMSSRNAVAEKIEQKIILSSSVPLFWVSLFQMVLVWSPTLLTGVWCDSEDVGIFNAANRTAMLTNFILVAVNSIAAPKFAAMYSSGELSALESTAKKTAFLMTMLASPLLLIFLLVPNHVMSMFGDDFTGGSHILMILAIGQFINVATGSVGYILMMSGNERLMRNNLIICAFGSVALNVILIPLFGITGAALTSALVLGVQNFIAVFLVWKKLNIITLPFFWRTSQA